MDSRKIQVILGIDAEECKGCALCVESCPEHVLTLSSEFNRSGRHPAVYAGARCTGCGICYYCCPEPGVIRIERAA